MLAILVQIANISSDFYFLLFAKMLDFIYDSLETVKKLKFPTVKQFAQLTGAIFWLVIVAWLYFILCDTIFSEGYKMFYASMTGWEEAVEDIEAVPAEDSGLALDDLVVEQMPIEDGSVEEAVEEVAE